MTYEILPAAAVFGVACLGALTLAGQAARRQMWAQAGGPALGDLVGTWAAQESRGPHLRLVTTHFGMEAPAPGPARAEVTTRLERLRHALDQLTALLMVASAGEQGGAALLTRLGDRGGPIDGQVVAAAVAMRRLGTLMLSIDGGEAFLVAPSAAASGEDAARAVWSDFLAALAFLTGACQRRATTIHLAAVDAAAQAIEDLCGSLAQTGLLAGDKA